MLKSGEKKNNDNLFLCLFKKGNFFDEFSCLTIINMIFPNDHTIEIKYR